MRRLPLDIPWRGEQYALGWIWLVSLWSYPRQHALYVLLEILGHSPHAGIVRVPWFCDIGLYGADLTDEWEDPYEIGDDGKEIPPGHALINMQ